MGMLDVGAGDLPAAECRTSNLHPLRRPGVSFGQGDPGKLRWILRLKTSSGPESGKWWEMPIRFIKGPREIRQKPEKPGDNSRKESWAPGLMDLGRGPGVFRLEIYGA